MTSWLVRALEESRERGFLGPGPVEPHIEHALGFAQCWEASFGSPPEFVLDLGSGGGLPGLVLLDRWRCRGVLLDAMQKRTRFLSEVQTWEGVPAHWDVVTGRAEALAREPIFDEVFNLVVARSFGPPSVVAECSARFLRVGGALVVSEPPDDDDVTRWSTKGLDELGLADLGRVRFSSAFRVLRKTRPTHAKYPRAIGVPKKNPLF